MPAGRGAVRTLVDGTCLVDDTYNANPDSVRAALASLVEIAAVDGRRTLVVLGEMKELGAASEAEHISLGETIASSGVAVAISCGGRMDLAIDAAAKRGVRGIKGRSTEDAAEIALREVRAGDAVLVKGSRSVGTESIVTALVQARGGAA
jgi:UDP-N-acetylmuramoyl-tripeptide--D-alanyl-D-alanine ligase